ncbi:hypothetical protein B0H34DRAFT_153543 [Crassisporium funariophilum]|nr:hypothetical protein B0H34DRAFT_153543 [Crassisporium funariophilum]
MQGLRRHGRLLLIVDIRLNSDGDGVFTESIQGSIPSASTRNALAKGIPRRKGFAHRASDVHGRHIVEALWKLLARVWSNFIRQGHVELLMAFRLDGGCHCPSSNFVQFTLFSVIAARSTWLAYPKALGKSGSSTCGSFIILRLNPNSPNCSNRDLRPV